MEAVFSTIAWGKTKIIQCYGSRYGCSRWSISKRSTFFLIVGHTKNAADSLFNSLKHEYRKQNIYTMQGLYDCLDASDAVTVVPASSRDFLDYDILYQDLYRNLAGKVKSNHIFSVSDQNPTTVIHLRESNLNEHPITLHRTSKKKAKIFASAAELKAHSNLLLLPIKCLGMNPYKMVELWKNYRPMVPVEYQDDILYAKPDSEVMAKVKDEKAYRAETRVVLKGKKYGATIETIEDLAFGDSGGGI